MTREEIIQAIKDMSVIELNELVKTCEEEFGVSASAPAAAAGAATAAVEEKTEFDVILTSVGPSKIKIIKIVREITGLGLKDAKDVVDAAPKTIKEGISKDDAAAMKAKIEEVGGTAEVK
ncbi:50S ribosomal protein L7/L12 [Clostridium psychrophilum]|uniref:50S ribosomal protein L7/L12 n=1 Tax=Clostridium psychrophilum TaxID=132926 RepID=UPI001C0CD3DC|nr:50S ribosomal protein L7/L12 [Clostridium psychrophilum]MBU3181447.1 50S ribosomal protein L7/L12 [Clostridium psychrophilum]